MGRYLGMRRLGARDGDKTNNDGRDEGGRWEDFGDWGRWGELGRTNCRENTSVLLGGDGAHTCRWRRVSGQGNW